MERGGFPFPVRRSREMGESSSLVALFQLVGRLSACLSVCLSVCGNAQLSAGVPFCAAEMLRSFVSWQPVGNLYPARQFNANRGNRRRKKLNKY